MLNKLFDRLSVLIANNSLFVILSLLAIIITTLHLDIPIFLAINELYIFVPDNFLSIVNFLSNAKHIFKFHQIPCGIFFITTLLLAALFRKNKFKYITLTIILFYIVFMVLKIVTHEPRPFIVLAPNSFHLIDYFLIADNNSYASFPSAHTGHVALSIFLLNRLFFTNYRLIRYWLYIVIAVVALVRIISGWHWPVDVVSGILIAYILANIYSLLVKSNFNLSRPS